MAKARAMNPSHLISEATRCRPAWFILRIWTLEVETFAGRAKILTVEVQNGARLICQARGKCNMLPGDKHRGILRRWVENAGLSLAKYV
jgi:hypothetical protein